MYVCMYVCCICICVRMYVCLYVYVCVYICVYVYMHFLIGCTNDIYTSDHSPMYSVFTIEKVGQHAGSGEYS